MIRLDENEVMDLIVPAILHRCAVPSASVLYDGEDFFAFARQHTTLATFWNECPRSDWMLWTLEMAVRWKLSTIDLDSILSRFTIDVEAVHALGASLDDLFALVTSQADILRS